MKLGSKMLTGFAVGAMALAVGFSAAASNAPAVGTAAPDFTLNSQENKAVSLHDFKGKWVVLYFYPKDFNTGGRAKGPNSQAARGNTRRKNRLMFALAFRTKTRTRSFAPKK